MTRRGFYVSGVTDRSEAFVKQLFEENGATAVVIKDREPSKERAYVEFDYEGTDIRQRLESTGMIQF